MRGVATAGPWVPAPGHFYLELREQLTTTDQGFDAEGHRHALATYAPGGALVPTRLDDAQTSLYAEIGIATRLAAVVDLVLLRSITMPRPGLSARSALGVGDLRAGLRLVLLDEEVTCSLDARIGIPTGRSDGDLPLGPGDLRGELELSFGRVFDRVPIFVDGSLGARLRSSGTQRAQPGSALLGAPGTVTVDYASELTYALELGYAARVSERLRVVPRVSLDGHHGLQAPPAQAATNGPMAEPLQPASLRMVRVGAALALGVALDRSAAPIRRGRLDVQVAGGAFVWGEGLPAAGDVSLSLAYAR